MFCIARWLGLVDYGSTYQLQKDLVNQRFNGEVTDVLLLLEHHPTITLGKSGKLENILVSELQLKQEGISLFFTDRGGDATYHGPGQLVGYLIVDLRQRSRNVHKFVHQIEEVIIRTLTEFDISAGRDETHPGIWVNNNSEELAAIGIAVKRGITMHGFALNINPELRHFSLINPCGLVNKKVTSVSKILGHDVSIETVIKSLLVNFSEVFETPVEMRSDLLNWQRS